ncbi:MAG TPA: hypothetical protein VMS84_07930 [Mycobacterium sp.]|jgi:hypothetical protein|nr:hypothetical protein [Mycobacterium sp.]
MGKQLDQVLAESKQCLRAVDDPRNWPSPAAQALKLLVAYIEDGSRR